MFYSTEVLTSRKYGVATIWLVATLGSKSTLKKVSRKAILDVDVAKACETIENPDAPMALRLQSNLLYGVTRVYAQQCGYVLSDAESARNNMRAIFRVMQQAELELEGGNKRRAEQLILQDDPNFLPDLDLVPAELENFDFNIDLNETQMSLTPGGLGSQLSNGSQQSIGGLDIPPSNSSYIGGAVGGLDLFSIRGDSGPGTAIRAAPQLLNDDDLGLDIGDEPATVPSALAGQPPSSHPAGGGATDDLPDQPMLDNDDGFMMNNNEDFNLDGDYGPAVLPPVDEHDPNQEHVDSATAEAGARKKREKRPAKLDNETELHNSKLAEWGRNYLEKMREESRKTEDKRIAAIAKQNAVHWVLNAGLFVGQGMRGPLDMFSGAALIEAFTRINPLGGKKRRSEDNEAASSSPKRSRIEGPNSDEVASGGLQNDNIINDDDVHMNYDGPEIEQGREAPTPLDDRQHSSIFPWNLSAGMGSRGGHPTSTSLGAGPLNILNSRRGSRLTSASPLVGRGGDQGGDIDQTDFRLSDDIHMTGEDEFELYGAAAQVDTQTAAHSQWQNAALTGESTNFLDFVQNAIQENAGQGGRDSGIQFDTLLPPESNSQIVTAQAFLHALTLAAKGALEIEQEEHFDTIWLNIPVSV